MSNDAVVNVFAPSRETGRDDAVADRVLYVVDPTVMQHFDALIDEPTGDAAQRLLASESPWES